ncbi:hypothetical protein V498_10206, partial [Pseudogymnoascus sp. VKM F-4517 (FW-2822)]
GARQGRDEKAEAGRGGGLEAHSLEEDGHVEDDGVDGDCADEVGEYEVAAWGAGEEINRHDGAGGVILDVDEEWRANDEDGEGGED